MDYRYFPDPDLLPLVLEEAFIESVRATLPELPDAKKTRFASQYGLSAYDAGVLTATREMADFYEKTATASGGEPKLAANWVMGDLSAALNKANLEVTASPVGPEAVGGLVRRIVDGTISGKIAKEVFEAMWAGEGDADAVIERRGLRQVTDTGAIERLVDEVMAANPDQVAGYRAGKEKLLGFFVGQVMKASGGKANPKVVQEILARKIKAIYGG
jgi:aspartyl-tRNA(Asn)/glutamyl-tRNA(Gln) amidotransferase subunit B